MESVTQLAEAREALELRAIEIQRAALDEMARDVGLLQESWDIDDDRPRAATRSRPRNALSMSAQRAWISILDNAEGRYWPFYETEQDIWRNLAATRNLASYDSTAIGAAQALRSYVLTGEWEANVTYHGQDKTQSQEARKVQAFIGRVLDRWEFWDVALPDIVDRRRQDGERHIVLRPDGEIPTLDFFDPEQNRKPANTYALNEWLSEDTTCSWYFGVHCRKSKHGNKPDWFHPIGYHFVEDDAGRDWDYVPSWPQANLSDMDLSCCYHWKANSPIKAARGVSDFYPIMQDLERCFKIYRNAGDGAAIQAAIAMVIQRETSSRASTINDVAGNAIDAVNQMRVSGSGTTYTRRFDPGTVVETDKGSVYNPGPMGQPSGQNFTEVAQALLRARISVRWNMPEYLISGDASNQNYASALVSESPFVKHCEREQTEVKGMIQQLLWRALRIAYLQGRFNGMGTWEEFEAAVDLDIVSGEVASRDVVAQTQRLSTLHDKGILTGKRWAQMEGLPEEEVEERQAMPMGGVGGGNPATPGAGQAAQPDAQLNGAQINAAVDVMVQLRQNILMPDAAKALLMSVGIDQAKAEMMVNQTSAAPPLQADDVSKAKVASIVTGESTAHSDALLAEWRRTWLGYP